MYVTQVLQRASPQVPEEMERQLPTASQGRPRAVEGESSGRCGTPMTIHALLCCGFSGTQQIYMAWRLLSEASQW